MYSNKFQCFTIIHGINIEIIVVAFRHAYFTSMLYALNIRAFIDNFFLFFRRSTSFNEIYGWYKINIIHKINDRIRTRMGGREWLAYVSNFVNEIWDWCALRYARVHPFILTQSVPPTSSPFSLIYSNEMDYFVIIKLKILTIFCSKIAFVLKYFSFSHYAEKNEI